LFRKITETVSKGVSTATEKAQQTVEITRLHAQISGKRKEIEKRYIEIGELVYESYSKGAGDFSDPKIGTICGEISGFLQEIEGLDERMMQLKGEKECECGRKVPYDSRFCPSCGHKFPEPGPGLPLERKEESSPAAGGTAGGAAGQAEDRPGSGEERSASDWADVGTPTLTDTEPTGWISPESAAKERAVCRACGASMEASSRFCPSCGLARS